MTGSVRLRSTVGGLATALLLATAGAATDGVPPAAAAAGPHDAAPVRSVVISGAGVATYPEFDPDVARYAITTTGETMGTVTVTATTSGTGGSVLVDGRPAPGGVATVTGLREGDEVAVWVSDDAGTERWTYVYLPSGFPALERTTPPTTGLAPGQVMLTLSDQWFAARPDFFETVVDTNGVPSYVHARRGARSLDLQRQPDGHYTVARLDLPGTPAGEVVVELDEQFREVARHRTVGLVHTDGHDAILEPDGDVWLMAYEPDGEGHLDSVIQRIDPAGRVTFEWSTAGLESETVSTPDDRDYAHLNSLQLVPGEDAILASFRHFSSVFKIDTSTPTGSVVWKLGGRDSDFTFVDVEGRPDGGPCAQHTARMLPNGDVMVFDNGSGGIYQPFCLEPGDPGGPATTRPQTRVATFRLDEEAGVATVVRSVEPPGRFAWFAGSSQPLPGGHTMVGWSSAALDAAHPQVATELDADGDVVWELANPEPSRKFFTYRAHKAVVPDANSPAVTVDSPAAGTTYVEGDRATLSFGCTDRGGSSLASCSADQANGAVLDTSRPGRHSVRVTATDGAGLTTSVVRSWTVLAASRPAAAVRAGTGEFRSRAALALRRSGATARVAFRVRNDGARTDRLTYAVAGRSPRFSVRAPRTARSVVLRPGGSTVVVVRIRRLAAARPGDRVDLRLRVSSPASARVDSATARVTARG